MASKKRAADSTQYCRIVDWVSEQDNDFSGAISHLCMEGPLNPRKTGITFLYPADKAFRQEIVDKAYGGEADEAKALLKALIIPDALFSAADFKSRDVGSYLGVKYDVESAEGSKVKLAGMTIAHAKDFRTLEDKKDVMAVWRLESGRPPLKGAEYKPSDRPRPKRVGGAERAYRGGSCSCVARRLIASAAESEYVEQMNKDRCVTCNPFLDKVVSLLNFLRGCGVDGASDTLTQLYPLLDFEPLVAFYLIFEPYKTVGDYLVSDSLLQQWGGVSYYDGDAVQQYLNFFANAGTAQALKDQNDGARDAILAQTVPPQQAPELMKAQYQQAVGADAAPLAWAKKRWQDELRLTLSAAVGDLRFHYSRSTFAGDFANLVSDICLNWPGNDYDAEEPCKFSDAVQKSVQVWLFIKFVNSSDFLYQPVAPGAVGDRCGTVHNPTDLYYNRNVDSLASLRQTTGMKRSNLWTLKGASVLSSDGSQ